MVRDIKGKISIENDLKGNENWFELAGVRVSYRESTVEHPRCDRSRERVSRGSFQSLRKTLLTYMYR